MYIDFLLVSGFLSSNYSKRTAIMEKLKNFSLDAKIIRGTKARIAVSLLVAAGSLVATPQAEGKVPYVSTPYKGPFTLVLPSETSSPIRISENINTERKKELEGENRDNSLGGLRAVDVSPSPISTPLEASLSPKEQKIQDLQNQADQYLKLAKESGKFNADLLGDLHDNLPFYLAAGEKYNIDWKILWVIHERESGASDPNSAAFASGNATGQVQGSWQININWGADFANQSYDGLQYTEVFPQRHEGDRIGAAEAARMLRTNIDQYEKLGYDRALFNAMFLYCGQKEPTERIVGGQDEVNKRLDMINQDNKIFTDQLKADSQNAGKVQ
jgi:hypothetical protein